MPHHPQTVNSPLRRLCAVISAIAIGFSLVGCGSYSAVSLMTPEYQPKAPGTGPVRNLIRDALTSTRKDPMVALAGFIDAARIASDQLRKMPSDMEAREDYSFAVGRIVSIINEEKLDPWSQPLRVPASGGDFILAHKPDPRPQWNPALYDFTPADEFDIKGSYVTERTTRPGLGAPSVAVGKAVNKSAREDFAISRIYYGVTAVVHFEGRRCEIEIKDPLADETVRLGGRSYPLAADFTVPLAVMLAAANPKKIEIARVFRPAEYAETARISRLQPYDPDKTVLLVIHGLMDSPATWTPMINSLRGDAEFRKNYQVWFYSYPSGYPYPYSASILRRELDAIEKRFPLKKPMVVMGHSMGGCISRILMTDSGDKLWMDIFGKPPEQVKLSSENRQLLTEWLIFRHRPEVGRVIFISAPLRGSDLANDWFGRLASKLVRAPGTLLKVGADAVSLVTFQPGDLQVKRMPNSIDTLSPDSRLVKAINTIPVTPGIPYHTIMGNRGKDGPPDCSDGVVPYWSSHMDGAQSECIVPSGHSAHQNAEAITEVRRILKLHRSSQ
ncbi:MAG: alpha/beta hydrolase [Akkermansiaceae bacterium]|nr:alpha/beta hydrolase [Akkermansiaceae bacterium]